MRIETVNPATEEVISSWKPMSREQVFAIADASLHTFPEWGRLGVAQRAPFMRELAEVLRGKKEEYGRLITLEMGKPITDAVAEVEKCAWTADVYADKGEEWLRDEAVSADGLKHVVTYEPLGLILSIMPWNFPFWQALRFAIPTLLAGNVSVLKHASNVPQCAFAIEEAFTLAGFPENAFRTVIADHTTIEDLIASDRVQGVSLTGSTGAGMKIAEVAGRSLKKVVLELGGSDPFIVLDDADVDFAAENAALGRLVNTGQSCIAAKRFIVAETIAERFSERFAEHADSLTIGDPMERDTQIGPLVNESAVRDMEAAVEDALSKGATLLTGGKPMDRKGYYYPPTLLTGVTPDMKVVAEEVFGPVAPVISIVDDDAAVRVANASEFGLGASVWTKDLERGARVAGRLEAGSVFINGIVKSDPRMPFGGVKRSGHGRELSKFGIREFVNVKGLSVYEHGGPGAARGSQE